MMDSFPVLKEEEIVVHLNSMMDVNLTTNDFKAIQVEKWQQVYLIVIQHVFDIHPDQLIQDLAGCESEPIEIYENAKYLCRLARAMGLICRASRMNDFSMKDVVSPTRKKLITIMSGLINYFFFRQTRLDVYEEYKADEAKTKEIQASFTEQNDYLQRKINAMRAKSVEEEPESQKINEAISELSDVMKQKQESVLKIRNEKNDMKLSNSNQLVKIADVRNKCAAVREKKGKLSRMIVSSPERMKKDMENMTVKVEQLKKTKEDRLSRLMELQTQYEAKVEVSKEGEHALRLLNKIGDEITKHKAGKDEERVLSDKIQEEKENLREKDREEKNVKRKLTTKQEKLAKMTLKHEYYLKEQNQLFQQYKSEQEDFGRAQKKDTAEVEAILAENKDLDRVNEIKEEKYNRIIKAVDERFSQILTQLNGYDSSLEEGLDHLLDNAK